MNLVLAASYPDNKGNVSLMYIHVRNKYYKDKGLEITVLNFNAKEDYIFEGIPVITYRTYLKEKERYKEKLIIHAPNIRKHYRFLLRMGRFFSEFVFFFHGHEVMYINKDYSDPYPFVRKDKKIIFLQNIYDFFKLKIWKSYLSRTKNKSQLVFVSKWMLDEFEKNVGINLEKDNYNWSIIYNCVGELFEEYNYEPYGDKVYDFITIRGNIDGSKYAIDIVNQIAKNTPEKRFLVIGKGEFFNHYEKATNLDWENKTLGHKEIISVLQMSRFALMPTRTDAQGLMMCEMAALGIPIITSDIPVCHEVFGAFDNAYYINNDAEKISLSEFTSDKSRCIKHEKYYRKNTVQNEVKLIERVTRL